VVNLLYNIVDRIYIGHIPEIGGLALTGVGLFTPILMLITASAMLAGAGGAPRAAIAMGRGDRDGAEKIMGAGIAALMDNEIISYPYCYETYEVLDNGPLRFTVKFTFRPIA
jgi:Na+-driven multidrug efflux pump